MALFVDAMDEFGRRANALQLGENGAPELTVEGVGNDMVAFFDKLIRNVPDENFNMLFDTVIRSSNEDPDKIADIIVLAFQTRATRNMGKGEKDLFYKFILRLYPIVGKDTIFALLPLIPHFGYLKDFILLYSMEQCPAELKTEINRLFANLLKDDFQTLCEMDKCTNEKLLKKGKEFFKLDKKKSDEVPKINKKNLTLIGKWAPREGSQHTAMAKELAKTLFGGNINKSLKNYRHLCVELNKILKTPEVYMAAQKYSEIEFSRVASLCLQRFRKAFMNETVKGKMLPDHSLTGNRFPHNADRVAARQALVAAVLVEKGNKLKGKQLQPHEIVNKCIQGNLSDLEIGVLQAQWNALVEGVKEALATVTIVNAETEKTSKHIDLGKLVALVDVSGSMTGTPMQVAIALGIIVSELCHPNFRNRVLTFETHPQWIDLSDCNNINDKVKKLQHSPWGGSTDFEAACEMILAVAKNQKLPVEEVPDLIVFSDMQFNVANGDISYYYGHAPPVETWETHLERLQRRFDQVGRAVCGIPYAAPRIVFWNLRGDTDGYAASANTPNVQMLSAYSPALLKLVLAGGDIVGEEIEMIMPDGTVKTIREGITPWETLRLALDNKDFYPVRAILSDITSGPLMNYTFVPPEE